MLTVAFCGSTMSRTQVQLWYNRFKEGQEDVNNDTQPRTTSNTSRTDKNIEAVKKMILDRWIFIREVTDDVGISFGSCKIVV